MINVKHHIAIVILCLGYTIQVLNAQTKSGIEFIISPVYSQYDIDRLHPFQNVSDQWDKSVKFQVRYNRLLKGNHSLVVGLGYSKSEMNTSFNYSSDEAFNENLNALLPKELSVGELLLNYCYRYNIVDNLSILPELGFSLNIPYHSGPESLTYEQEGEVIMYISTKKFALPNLAINGGLWLCYSLNERNHLKLGFSGSLPLFKTTISTFEVYPEDINVNLYDLETGLGYYGLGLGYQFMF